MADKVLIDDKAVLKSQTKVEFLTTEALKAQVPSWANWMFRIVAVLTTVVAFYVAGTTLIQEQWKVEVMLGLKTLDMLTLGLSKLFGVVEK